MPKHMIKQLHNKTIKISPQTTWAGREKLRASYGRR